MLVPVKVGRFLGIGVLLCGVVSAAAVIVQVAGVDAKSLNGSLVAVFGKAQVDKVGAQVSAWTAVRTESSIDVGVWVSIAGALLIFIGGLVRVLTVKPKVAAQAAGWQAAAPQAAPYSQPAYAPPAAPQYAPPAAPQYAPAARTPPCARCAGRPPQAPAYEQPAAAAPVAPPAAAFEQPAVPQADSDPVAAAAGAPAAGPSRFCAKCGGSFADETSRFCVTCGAPRPGMG